MRQAHPPRACALAVLQYQERTLQHENSVMVRKKARIVAERWHGVNTADKIASRQAYFSHHAQASHICNIKTACCYSS
jgi:hypothetical protein